MSSQARKRRRLNEGARSDSADVAEEDISIVGKSIDISVGGVKQLIKAVTNGTEQFQDLVCNECVLIYECKVCRNLFRSLANFLSHKVKYCLTSYFPLRKHPSNDTEGNMFGSRANSQTCSEDQGSQEKVALPSSTVQPCFIQTVPNLLNAVYQTLVENDSDNMKDNMDQLEKDMAGKEAVLMTDGTAVLSEDGKVVDKQVPCTMCSSSFVSASALANHVQLSHRPRICYSCPLCQLVLASPFSVFRHLRKLHNKSEDQIRRLRRTILKKGVERELYQADKTTLKPSAPLPVLAEETHSQDDKWYAQFENKMAACRVCGKGFGRRAARDVHAKTCKPVANVSAPTKENREQLFSTKSTIELVNSTEQKPKNEPLHVCNLCGVKFSARRSVTRHMKKCQGAILRSPLRHLMSPAKCMPHVGMSSPRSVILVRRDYNKPISPAKIIPPRLLNTNGSPSRLMAFCAGEVAPTTCSSPGQSIAASGTEALNFIAPMPLLPTILVPSPPVLRSGSTSPSLISALLSPVSSPLSPLSVPSPQSAHSDSSPPSPSSVHSAASTVTRPTLIISSPTNDTENNNDDVILEEALSSANSQEVSNGVEPSSNSQSCYDNLSKEKLNNPVLGAAEEIPNESVSASVEPDLSQATLDVPCKTDDISFTQAKVDEAPKTDDLSFSPTNDDVTDGISFTQANLDELESGFEGFDPTDLEDAASSILSRSKLRKELLSHYAALQMKCAKMKTRLS